MSEVYLTFREKLRALRYEAGIAGDLEMVAIANMALAGDVKAAAECARVMTEEEEE
jgi:hypothetical protein